jgi:hypothetical protein
MMNLIRFRLKRYIYRWETFTAALVNIITGCLSGTLLLSLYRDINRPGIEDYFFPAAFMLSLFCTMSAVIITEDNNISNGAVRNQLIAGYTKTKIYASTFITVFIYSIVQGLFMTVPLYIFGNGSFNTELSDKYKICLLISLILMYSAVSCLAVTVSVLSGRKSITVLICTTAVAGLTFAGMYADKRLDTSKYHYKEKYYVWEDSGGIIEKVDFIKNKNMLYVGGHSRDALEQFVRFDPMKPVFDFSEWYFSDRHKVKSIDEQMYERSPQYAAETDDKMALYDSHTHRLLLFPYYQAAFIALIGAVSLIAFRKRSIK